MYVINPYELVADVHSKKYLLMHRMGARIDSTALLSILHELSQQKKHELTEAELIEIAEKYAVDLQHLKDILIKKMHLLKPLLARKFVSIDICSDDELVANLIGDTLRSEYDVHYRDPDFLDFSPSTLVIDYRKNYSNPSFDRIANIPTKDVYWVTCGVMHHHLLIDNLYTHHRGLPTHLCNLHQVMKGNIPSIFRHLFPHGEWPTTELNLCQRGYIAYVIYQFLTPFIRFDAKPMPLDNLNWCWRVDLLTFDIQKEVAIHRARSAADEISA